MSNLRSRSPFLWVLLLGLILSSCSSTMGNSGLIGKGTSLFREFFQSPEEESMGFRVEVDYGEEVETYIFKTHLTRLDVIDLFSELSLQENPSMRFITTRSSIEIYDVYGIRNNFQKEWSVYINGRWISGESLKKGVIVDWNSKIVLRYGKAYRIPLPSR